MANASASVTTALGFDPDSMAIEANALARIPDAMAVEANAPARVAHTVGIVPCESMMAPNAIATKAEPRDWNPTVTPSLTEASAAGGAC